MDYRQKLNRNLRLFNWLNFFTSFIFIIPIWVAFERRFLSFTQMALLEAISTLAIVILELPTGALADLIGRRKTIILGLIIRGLGTIYMAFGTNFDMFLISFLISAIGSVFVSGADVALAYDSLKQLNKENTYPKFAAKNSLFSRFAIIFATFLGAYLYQINIGLPFILQGLFLIFSSIMVYLMVEPVIDSQKFTLKSYLNQTKVGFGQLFQNKYVRKLTFYYTLVAGITWSCLFYFNQPFAYDLGFSEVGIGQLFALIYLLTTVLIYFLTTQNPRFLNRETIFIAFPLIMVISYLPSIFVGKALGSFILFSITLIGSARFSLLDRFTNAEFDSKYRATAISSLNMMVSIFYIVIVGLSGKIQDIYGTKPIFTVLGLISIGIIPIAFSLIKHYDRNHQ